MRERDIDQKIMEALHRPREAPLVPANQLRDQLRPYMIPIHHVIQRLDSARIRLLDANTVTLSRLRDRVTGTGTSSTSVDIVLAYHPTVTLRVTLAVRRNTLDRITPDAVRYRCSLYEGNRVAASSLFDSVDGMQSWTIDMVMQYARRPIARRPSVPPPVTGQPAPSAALPPDDTDKPEDYRIIEFYDGD